MSQAVRAYGTSVSAARIIGGEIPLHGSLERAIADFLGVEDALVQVGGHSTNVNVISHLMGVGDLVLHDALAHNSIVQGAIASGAQRKSFRHNDAVALDRELTRIRDRFENVLVVIEGVYSMDGDIADLEGILSVAERHDAFLMVDEAHSLGTIGAGGRGICAATGVDPNRVDILMGTLSKSLNSCGGYIAGNADLIRYLRFQLPGFLFSVGLSPSNTAAALESLRMLTENPEWTKELIRNADRLREGMRLLGIDTGLSEGTPIVPWIVGDSQRTVEIAERLLELGVYVAPITYPAVAEQEARLRFFVGRGHTDSQIDQALEAIGSVSA